jgi:hypothetical protein
MSLTCNATGSWPRLGIQLATERLSPRDRMLVFKAALHCTPIGPPPRQRQTRIRTR